MNEQTKRINSLLPETLRADYRAFQFMDMGGKWHIRMGRDLHTVHEDTIVDSLIFGGIHMASSECVTVVKSCLPADKRVYEYSEFIAFGDECKEHHAQTGRNSIGYNEPIFGSTGPQIVLGVRGRHEDFFSKCPSFQSTDNRHFPFLVFEVESGLVEVKTVYDPTLLLSYPGHTQVMVQWPGKWSSDFFSFKVSELVEHMGEHGIPESHLGQPSFGEQYKIPDRRFTFPG